jgi:acetyl-CoA carboxylase carboxyltransferase component
MTTYHPPQLLVTDAETATTGKGADDNGAGTTNGTNGTSANGGNGNSATGNGTTGNGTTGNGSGARHAAGEATGAILADPIQRLRATRLAALDAGGPDGTERQHRRGKLTARERIGRLVDEGTFQELETLRRHRATGFGMERRRPPGDGVVAGWGEVDGRRIFVYAHDFRVFGGSLGEAHAQKIHKVLDLAATAGVPVIGLNDGAGARIQEGVTALAGYGGIFRRNVAASGVVPQISVMLGPCAGGASYSPALTDFVFMVRGTSNMFLTGPDVIRAVTGEEISQEDLGGADVHGTVSGLASFVYDDEETCFEAIRYLLTLLPDNNRELPPAVATADPPGRRCDALSDIVPREPNKPYDMRDVVAEIVDDGDFLEVAEGFAGNVVCALARLDGHVTGVVANQPMVLGGALDIAAAEKAARFVRTCDAFNIPLLTLVDVPGFLPGVDQERGGIIRHGAKLLYAYCEATVPRIQVIVRKAYGGAYIVMDSRSIGADLSYAWPGNEIAVMGAQAATNVIYRRELLDAADPETVRAQLTDRYAAELMHPYYAAERGLVDDVIEPGDTRAVICAGLAMLRAKHQPLPARKHGNQPM